MIIHLIHYPVSAKQFVEPIVTDLLSRGVDAQLWLEHKPGLEAFTSSIDCPKKFAKFDLTLNPFSVFSRIVKLSKDFKKITPVAIHAHQTRAALIPLLAAKIAQVPVRIYHNHGTPYLGYKSLLRTLLQLLEKINCCFATHVLTVSDSIRKEMINSKICKQNKCRLIGSGSVCGIDLEEFSKEMFDEEHRRNSRRKLDIPFDSFVAIYVGRPYKRKGFDTLVKAWKKLDKNDILLLCGCSRNDVLKVIGKTPDNIVALVYTMNMIINYAASDVVVLPSRHEGLPYSLLEGSAAGKPLIGCDVPGINSLIQQNENGIMVPVANVDKLAQAIVRLKENPDLRSSMGKNARRIITKRFERNMFLKKLFEYYTVCLQKQ